MSDSGGVAEQEPDPSVDPIYVMTDTELETYARTLRLQLEFAQRDAGFADELRAQLRAARADLLTTKADLAEAIQQHVHPRASVPATPNDPAVDIDALTERLSLQDWRSARSQMYAALRELRALRALLVVERARANQTETEVKRLETYIDTWESRDGDGDYALLLRAEAALERVKALCDETDKRADRPSWGGFAPCIVTTDQIRAALGAVLVDTNPPKPLSMAEQVAAFPTAAEVIARLTRTNPETTTEGTE